jgi:hypothetical protein
MTIAAIPTERGGVMGSSSVARTASRASKSQIRESEPMVLG